MFRVNDICKITGVCERTVERYFEAHSTFLGVDRETESINTQGLATFHKVRRLYKKGLSREEINTILRKEITGVDIDHWSVTSE